MSVTFRCDDKETLVAYLYGEIDIDAKREVDRHLRTCLACADEVAALQSVRRDLESWMPPVPDLGLTVAPTSALAPQPATVLRPSRWAALGTMPAWAQVAAAVLVASVGAAIANVQVRYSTDGLVVSTGWMTPATAVAPAAAVAASKEEWRPALAALEQSLRSEMAQQMKHGDAALVAARAPESGVDQTAVLRRVQALVDASEQRQRQETSLMMTQFSRDVDMQRRADLMRINQSFGTLQGRTIKTEAGQAEMMNLLRRVAVQPVP